MNMVSPARKLSLRARYGIFQRKRFVGEIRTGTDTRKTPKYLAPEIRLWWRVSNHSCSQICVQVPADEADEVPADLHCLGSCEMSDP